MRRLVVYFDGRMTDRKTPQTPSGDDSTQLASESGPPLPPGIAQVRAQVRASLFGGGPPIVPFTPGTLVAGRYRIGTFLGEGGMGRVYRADDLVLDEEVAIKFLPRLLATDRVYLERFLQEVRVARKVSHPNVCRVHDIAESEGQYFLTMEFVDGEDLGSLLRRAGPLGPTRALEVASELCAGLTALHDNGILHRDLKPANVMVDRCGRVKLADFGLAGFIGRFGAAEIRQGTPAYQAPEQLAGQEVSTRSDIYSLGRILYELLHGPTAKLPDAAEFDASVRSDGVYGDTVRMCLDQDPHRRPASVPEVASLLGCDDLSLAIAQGKRPSPSTIANARSNRVWTDRQVWWALALIVVMSFVAAVIERSAQGLKGLHTMPPQELAVRARTFVESVQDSDAAVSEAVYVAQPTPMPTPTIGPNLPSFVQIHHWSFERYRAVTPGQGEPEPGETITHWTLGGDLVRYRKSFDAARPAVDDPIDWQPWFDAAALAVADTSPNDPPTQRADGTASFSWNATASDGTEVRVEAAARGGQAVAFEVERPGYDAKLHVPTAQILDAAFLGMEEGARIGRAGETLPLDRLASAIALLIMTLFVAFAVAISILVWRRIRSGAGDQRTGAKLALLMLATLTASDFLKAQTAGDTVANLGVNFIWGALTWALYVIVEPFVRLQMPRSLVGWNRLMQRGRPDPVVAAEILVGIATGSAFAMLYAAHQLAAGFSASSLFAGNMLGVSSVVAGMSAMVSTNILYTCGFVTMLAVGQALVRRVWILGAVFGVVALALEAAARGTVPWMMLATLGYFGWNYWVLRRFGLLALFASTYTASVIEMLPWAHEGSAGWPVWVVLLGTSLWAAGIVRTGVVDARTGRSSG